MNWYTIYIFLFSFILGVLSEILICSGGMNAFVKWAKTKVTDTKSSELIVFFAGIIIFIDDYFNALSVGQIARPLSKMHSSSRERFAYIIDSTSAPVCILIPVSSWGAYIIGILQNNMPNGFDNPLFVLLESAKSNFYAWFALICVLLTILWQINLPIMRKNINIGVEEQSSRNFQISSVWLLFIPIICLILSIVFMIFYTGYSASKSWGIFDILAQSNTSLALFAGGSFTLLISLLLSYKYIPLKDYKGIFIKGILTMSMPVLIITIAWMLGAVIKEDLKTGIYLAQIAKSFLNAESFSYLPVFLFLISAFIAFATGTSWGCFAIMLPIAIGLSNQGVGNGIIAISAVLAGAVYGDHTSPISDTTILSAMGAGCSLQSHFITQLPYTSLCAFCALIGFLAQSKSGSTFFGLLIGLALLLAVLAFFKKRYGGALIGKENLSP